MKMPRPVLLRGRVTNGDGLPIPGASVNVNPQRYPRGFNTRLANFLVTRAAITDEDGRFAIGLPFREMTYYTYGRILIEKRWYSTQQQRLIEVGEALEENNIVIELPVPKALLKKKQPEEDKGEGKGDEKKRKDPKANAKAAKRPQSRPAAGKK